jgi:AAA+ ATPase superfamily predicted ATPase
MRKQSKIEINPFIVGRYPGEEYFCDRENETATLLKQIENGRNITLIAPRRIGKTGLIRHLFEQPEIANGYYTFFVDIYATANLAELVGELGKTIFQELKPRGKKMLERFFNMVRSLQFGFKVDAMSGEPSFQVGCSRITQPEATLTEIFQYLNNADKPCIVALDEFQQVGEYSDGNAEALLRTYIQQSTNCSFIFSGSKQHLMIQMFQSSKRPFYNSTTTIALGAIAADSYVEFAQRHFRNRKKDIQEEVVREMYQQVDGITWYMQLLLNEGFTLTPDKGTMTVDTYHIAWQNIIDLQSSAYQSILVNLTARQRELLRVIAKEREVENITSTEFIQRNHLSSASTVQAALRALLRDDLVERLPGGSYRIPDFFFAYWLSQQMA